jgi:3',5'-cyclic AMP phosphodiesterase CpdA
MLLVADIHFGANRTEAVDFFLKDAKNPKINTEKIIIIAGDMTENASKKEFLASKNFIDSLLETGSRLVFTPGNHDLGGWIGEYLMKNKKARSQCLDLMKPILSQKGVIAVKAYDSITKFDKNIFVSLRSTHRGNVHKFGILGINRIRREQITWAISELLSLNLKDSFLHFVTHRSMWRESGDKHTRMFRTNRLETLLFKKFMFHSIIHGHNHRFVFSCTSTPKLAIPTLSLRSRKWISGYVRWDSPFDKIPELVSVK